MRGRDRLAFRSKFGFFCVPGVVEVLVLPVKTNGPLGFGGEKIKTSFLTLLTSVGKCRNHSKIQKVPGVFVTKRDGVLTVLGFPPSATCFCGVLEVTQGDMRAGVFTIDLLYSLS